MHPTVVGLPCRLVLMVAHPGFPVDRPCDRQAPRAPLPHVGVTLMGKTSCAFSKGITLSSSLILAHAPSLHASSDFGFRPYTKGLCRLLPAPAASRLFPTLSLSYFPTCRDPYSSCSQGAVTRFFPLGHWPSPSEHGSALGIAPSQLLSDGERFWSCSHSFTFRPTGLFASQVAPTLTRICVWGSRDFYSRAYHGWLPAPCSGYANHPNRAIDGEGTRTPQVRQPCWLLRSLSFVSRMLTCASFSPRFSSNAHYHGS
jgi:hypothetical protein